MGSLDESVFQAKRKLSSKLQNIQIKQWKTYFSFKTDIIEGKLIRMHLQLNKQTY